MRDLRLQIEAALSSALEYDCLEAWGKAHIKDPNVYLIDCLQPDELALFLVRNGLGGRFYLSRVGLTWRHGQDTIYLIDKEQIEDIEACRNLYSMLTGQETRKWGIGAIGRQLIEWTGVNQKYKNYQSTGSISIDETGWHCYECQPGEHGMGHLHDMTTAYLSFFLRMPSQICTTLPDGQIIFHPMADRERDRLDFVLRGMETLPELRYSVMGGLASGKMIYFSQIEPSYFERYANETDLQFSKRMKKYKKIPKEMKVVECPPTPLTAGAKLTIASVYECCALAEDHIYKSTDCNVSFSEKPPKYWSDRKIKSKLKGSGEVDIICPLVYRVGEEKTDFYEHYKNGRLHFKKEPKRLIVQPKWSLWLDRQCDLGL